MSGLKSRISRLLSGYGGWNPAETDKLVQLMHLLTRLPPPPDPFGLYPQYEGLKELFLTAAEGRDPEVLEESFLELYCHLHCNEAPYTLAERRRVDETGGYWCHAGGLSPILKAGPFIRPETVSGDFGAGNGLQGLLLQKLYPHARTIQIEISSRMIDAGCLLQQWLGVPSSDVEWICKDVLDVSPGGIDFVYLYRPVRPEGEGRKFYLKLAESLAAERGRVTVFSIADCLREFLPPEFEVFYTDGHLTCFQRR